jgi:hypothetical protein
VGSFIILIVVAAVAVIFWRFHQQRQENKLRENFPRRRVIEVSLPRGVTNSNERMQKFYSKAVTATQGDPKARKLGMRQIDIVYLAEVQLEHTMADIRFLVYVDEDKMDAVKRALKQVFDGMAHVLEITAEHDPMEKIAAQLRPPQEEKSETEPKTEQEQEQEQEQEREQERPQKKQRATSPTAEKPARQTAKKEKKEKKPTAKLTLAQKWEAAKREMASMNEEGEHPEQHEEEFEDAPVSAEEEVEDVPASTEDEWADFDEPETKPSKRRRWLPSS